MALHHEEKTEPATPRRRAEARGKGNVARSQDLVAASLMLASFIVLGRMGPTLWYAALGWISAGLRVDQPTSVDEVLMLGAAMAADAMRRLAPFLLILLGVTLLALYLQIGWLLTLSPLTPSLGRLNPLNGLQRLLSIRSVVNSIAGILKVVIVLVVAYMTLSSRAADILYALTLGGVQMVQLSGSILYTLGLRIAVALFVLALLDWWWQRYRLERDLRMTKEEVKDELRSMEGDPQIKRRQRQLQLQFAAQRLRKEVPKADVVVTNPTHYAVAITYDSNTMHAPKVVAKGVDEIALRIRQLAAEFGVPVVERRALARALHDAVDVGQYVPERFYQAIAEILAYVYELTGRSPLEGRAAVGA